MKIPKEHKIIAVAQFITVAGLIVLWLLFYLSPSVQPDADEYRFLFDTTNPIPDTVLSLVLLFSGYSLLTSKTPGRSLSIVSALYLVLLSVLDVGIPIDGSTFAVSIIDITGNGALNLWCVVLGLYAIIKLRKPAE